MNIVVALEKMQWLPVEKWDNGLLQRYCEDRAIHQMLDNKIKTTLRHCPERDDNRSTMAIAFSCDGRYFASGHTSHDIIIGHMTPYVHYWKTLSGHDRTPWELTFDLERPHILYSGCLAGRVCKWDITERGSCQCLFDSNLSSPVNSITRLPSDSHLLLVAIRCNLFVLSTADLSVVWVTQTANFETVRLVFHHPVESKILTAISNDNYYLQTPAAPVSQRSTASARQPSSPLPESTGNMTSIDLSPHTGYLLLGFVARRSTFHYETRGLCDTEIHTFIDHRPTYSSLLSTPSNGNTGRFQIEKVGSIPTRGSNVAVWMPLNAGHGYGACIATSKSGSVLFWRTVELIDHVKFDPR